MVYKCFDKNSSGTRANKCTGNGVNNQIKQNQRLAEEFHKPRTKKFEKRKVYSSLRDEMWDTDLADMQ